MVIARRVTLGPVPCSGCGRLVEWIGDGWVDRGTLLVHDRRTCPGRTPTRLTLRRRAA